MIQKFLLDRSQCVKLGNNFSKACHASSGVTQGLCLGPILFNIFINPLLLSLKGVASAYTGDIKYAGNAFTNTREQIQQDIDIIYNWSDTMLISLSIAKCLVLNCGYNKPQWVFACGNASLPATNEIRDLRITRIADPEFSTNAAFVAAKAYRASGALLRSFKSRER